MLLFSSMKLFQKMQKLSVYCRVVILLFCSMIGSKANAQFSFSDSLQVSLITCSEGPDAYERFGHSAVRILDLRNNEDIVFHWGVFNFKAPHFVYRFVKGETDYQLGATYTDTFFNGYYKRGLAIKEQQLNLDKDEAKKLVNAIIENYRPENRVYRYSFFFDNCATRPFNLIEKATDHRISYDTAWVQPITLRDMVQQKSGVGNWLDLGISLAVASRSDKQAYFKEQMFLPEYLAEAYNHATIGDKALVAKEMEVFPMAPEVRAKIDQESILTSPVTVLIVVALIVTILGVATRRIKKLAVVYKSAESLVLFATGVTGAILWFLNFVSVHPAVDHNLNCLWLLPTNIIFAALIWVKSAEKVNRIYFFIIFALIIAYAIINWGFGIQYYSVLFLPIQFALLFIAKEHLVKKK